MPTSEIKRRSGWRIVFKSVDHTRLQSSAFIGEVLGEGLIEFVIERSQALEGFRMHTQIIR